jgi:IstB-like ATP binding protein
MNLVKLDRALRQLRLSGIEPRADPRPRDRPLYRTPRGRALSRGARDGEEHLAQAIGRAVIQQGYRVIYCEAHTLLEELADATLDGTRKVYLPDLAVVPLLIIDGLGMRNCRTPPPKTSWK